MEYEFVHDATTGNAKARFSLEHEVIGPWIEVELGRDTDKLIKLLTTIDTVEKGSQHEVLITGHEYSLLINKRDVEIYANASANMEDLLPDMLTSEHIHFDENESAACGLDDFRTLLLSWAEFVQNI